MQHPALGCIPPPDDAHRRKYPLLLSAAPAAVAPMVMGITWFDSFWKPEKDARGLWWIGRDVKRLGSPVGGHAVCLMPFGWQDLLRSWRFYDQGQEGACAAFAASRMQTLNGRSKWLYNGFPLYQQARRIDGLPDGAGEGTTLRAVCDVLRTQGAWPVVDGKTTGPSVWHGIRENRWAQSVPDALRVLNAGGRDSVQFLNSWGQRGYPQVTNIPVATLEFLWAHREHYLELMVVTDKPGPD